MRRCMGMGLREILLLVVMFWNLENFFDPFEGNSSGFVRNRVVDKFVETSGDCIADSLVDPWSDFLRDSLSDSLSLQDSKVLAVDTVVQKAVQITSVGQNIRRSSEENFTKDGFAKEPFTPQGEKFWTWKKFAKKRDDIAKTICLVKEECGVYPAIIGLCEVENRFVLQQLVENTPLAKLDYGIIHKDSPDRRGIDAALLYRKELFSPLKVQFIPTRIPTTPFGEPISTESVGVSGILLSRETVYVKGVFMGLDTLHCFVAHWPSKLGGNEALSNRIAASNTLKKIADSILCADSRANIIVMGDFNDSAESGPVENLDNLVNMSTKEFYGGSYGVPSGKSADVCYIQEKRKGHEQRYPERWNTYKYKEEWSRIDHFLISPWMYAGENGVVDECSGLGLSASAERQEMPQEVKWLFCNSGSSRVFSHKFLLEEDTKYLGYKIRRTLVGPRYNGGVSDHLPIILRVYGYEF